LGKIVSQVQIFRGEIQNTFLLAFEREDRSTGVNAVIAAGQRTRRPQRNTNIFLLAFEREDRSTGVKCGNRGGAANAATAAKYKYFSTCFREGRSIYWCKCGNRGGAANAAKYKYHFRLLPPIAIPRPPSIRNA
jgi:hypothetical protein